MNPHGLKRPTYLRLKALAKHLNKGSWLDALDHVVEVAAKALPDDVDPVHDARILTPKEQKKIKDEQKKQRGKAKAK